MSIKHCIHLVLVCVLIKIRIVSSINFFQIQVFDTVKQKAKALSTGSQTHSVLIIIRFTVIQNTKGLTIDINI